MAGFNPSTPTVRGQELQLRIAQFLKLDSALEATAMRFRGPGTTTIARVHHYLEAVNDNPGLAVEIVDTLLPAITSSTDYFPGTDTGATTTGWQDQGVAAANFGEIDDRYSEADYHTNSGGLGKQRTLALRFRSAAAALTGQRILKVDVGCRFHLRRLDGNDPRVALNAQLDIGGQTYNHPHTIRPRASTASEVRVKLGTWDLNPSTGLPWTLAEFNNFLTGGTDEFGIRVGGRLAANGFRLHGMWLTPHVCAENRKGFYYATGRPQTGWNELTLSGTSALAASTSYWVVISPLLGATKDFLRFRRLRDPDAIIDDTAAGTGEHRTAYRLRLYSRGGAAAQATEVEGAVLPVLLDSTANGIETPSQPYAKVDSIDVDRAQAVGTLPGQQITTAAVTTYAGILATVGWTNPQRRPNRPLTIEVRSGTGAISAGGSSTLHATATLRPKDIEAGPVRILIPFDATWANTLNQQVHLLVSSGADEGRGWRLFRLDTRSDDLGAGTTLNEVEGASQGGQTDSWFVSGAASDRYDLPLALYAAPTAPAGLTATVLAAA